MLGTLSTSADSIRTLPVRTSAAETLSTPASPPPSSHPSTHLEPHLVPQTPSPPSSPALSASGSSVSSLPSVSSSFFFSSAAASPPHPPSVGRSVHGDDTLIIPSLVLPPALGPGAPHPRDRGSQRERSRCWATRILVLGPPAALLADTPDARDSGWTQEDGNGVLRIRRSTTFTPGSNSNARGTGTHVEADEAAHSIELIATSAWWWATCFPPPSPCSVPSPILPGSAPLHFPASLVVSASSPPLLRPMLSVALALLLSRAAAYPPFFAYNTSPFLTFSSHPFFPSSFLPSPFTLRFRQPEKQLVRRLTLTKVACCSPLFPLVPLPPANLLPPVLPLLLFHPFLRPVPSRSPHLHSSSYDPLPSFRVAIVPYTLRLSLSFLPFLDDAGPGDAAPAVSRKAAGTTDVEGSHHRLLPGETVTRIEFSLRCSPSYPFFSHHGLPFSFPVIAPSAPLHPSTSPFLPISLFLSFLLLPSSFMMLFCAARSGVLESYPFAAPLLPVLIPRPLLPSPLLCHPLRDREAGWDDGRQLLHLQVFRALWAPASTLFLSFSFSFPFSPLLTLLSCYPSFYRGPADVLILPVQADLTSPALARRILRPFHTLAALLAPPLLSVPGAASRSFRSFRPSRSSYASQSQPHPQPHSSAPAYIDEDGESGEEGEEDVLVALLSGEASPLYAALVVVAGSDPARDADVPDALRRLLPIVVLPAPAPTSYASGGRDQDAEDPDRSKDEDRRDDRGEVAEDAPPTARLQPFRRGTYRGQRNTIVRRDALEGDGHDEQHDHDHDHDREPDKQYDHEHPVPPLHPALHLPALRADAARRFLAWRRAGCVDPFAMGEDLHARREEEEAKWKWEGKEAQAAPLHVSFPSSASYSRHRPPSSQPHQPRSPRPYAYTPAHDPLHLPALLALAGAVARAAVARGRGAWAGAWGWGGGWAGLCAFVAGAVVGAVAVGGWGWAQ
ncbi:hypothetical protein B0H15DRAFT_947752 [Mycena belliarum]|uniref:Uncharacterized protein n=1 Tax=Mycena belliarum TaxID=1033014 RepID=A0AAD6U8G2_9AGAR|nr:hypothetical protein B0H15DRAFT_947752 [Mycena belliae]